MQRLNTLSLILVALCCVVSAARAQQTPPSTTNAALRYWMAFAEMQDPPADKDTQALLERVASGAAPWDEQRLGKIVEQNTFAVKIMQRATRLPECNWGLEYELGPATPLAHLVKARVLARLNVLYGMRQAARGEDSAAVDTWLAGLRFAEHMAQGVSLIGALTAKAALLADLSALKAAIAAGSLDDLAVKRIDDAVRALPQFGLDWSDAVRMESGAGVIALNQFAQGKLSEEFFGDPIPAGVKAPSPADIAQFQRLMEDAAKVFEQDYAPPAELAALESRIRSLNPVIDRLVPSLARVNGSRQEAGQARRALLDAIANRRRR